MVSNRVRWSSRLDASLGGGPLREQALEYAPRDPDHAMVLADLDPELHGLPLGIQRAPRGTIGNGAPRAILLGSASDK